MTDRVGRWQSVQSLLERFPAYAKGTGPQRGCIVGAMVGLLVGVLLGVVLGMLNRGLVGALVGGLSAGVAGMALGGVIGWAIPRRRVIIGADIEIEDSREAFAPGETINGFVVLRSNGSAVVRQATVTLRCLGSFAHGGDGRDALAKPTYERSTKAYWEQKAVPVHDVRLRRGSVVRFPFSAVLPEDALATYHGFGCRVIWMLHLSVDAQQEVEPLRQEVTISHSPNGSVSGSSQAAVTCDLFSLSLSLPQLEYAEGDTIEGQVIVSPLGDISLRELRVALVRVERLAEGTGQAVYFSDGDPGNGEVMPNAHPSGQGTTYVWLERHETLAGEERFEATKGRRYPFSMPLARAWRPTMATPEGVVHWQLSAIASREGLPDVQASLRVEVYTSEPWMGRVLAS